MEAKFLLWESSLKSKKYLVGDGGEICDCIKQL